MKLTNWVLLSVSMVLDNSSCLSLSCLQIPLLFHVIYMYLHKFMNIKTSVHRSRCSLLPSTDIVGSFVLHFLNLVIYLFFCWL